MHAANRKQVFNEINITPLTDIFLVLLIIMMVVAPMMQQVRPDIKPPQLQGGQPVDQNKLTVEVTQDGKLYVMGQETSEAQLASTLQEAQTRLQAEAGAPAGDTAAAEPEEKNLIIRADKATKSGQVLKIFEAARDSGFTKITVAGDALTAERQGELQRQQSAGPMAPLSGSGGSQP